MFTDKQETKKTLKLANRIDLYNTQDTFGTLLK